MCAGCRPWRVRTQLRNSGDKELVCVYEGRDERKKPRDCCSELYPVAKTLYAAAGEGEVESDSVQTEKRGKERIKKGSIVGFC